MYNASRLAAAVGLVLFACGPSDSNNPNPPPITYSNQVSRLIQNHCEGCHRPEGLAPFALTSYEDAASRADLIADAVTSRRMPHGVSMRLDTGCADADTFEGPRRLTQQEIDVFSLWVELGAPEGDPADLPEPKTYPSGEWTMGDPDFETPNASMGFTLPPSVERDVFRRFVVAPDLDRDVFLTGFEALPDTLGGAGLDHIVHHVTLFINPGAEAFQQEVEFAASDPEIVGPGFEGDFAGYPVQLVGMWFPGSAPLEFPDGVGVRVPAGSALVFEVHYSPSGEIVTDRTRVGVKFADAVDRTIEPTLVKNVEFTIPAGDPAYLVDAARTFDQDLTVYSLTPHQHQLGTDFRIVVEPPGEDAFCLGDVEWDFEHQATYRLREPLELPAGTTIRTACMYDNSADNPHQFNDPPAEIPFGAVADREMCQLTVGVNGASAAPSIDPELVEVYYDHPADDDGFEYIKLRNPGDQPIDLSGYSLGWGGVDYSYGTLDLAGTLGPGECLIVGTETDLDPDLQNATDDVADGVALFRGAAAEINPASVPVDAVIYGVSNESGLLGVGGEAGAVDVAGADPGQSIRIQSGVWVIGAPAPGECP